MSRLENMAMEVFDEQQCQDLPGSKNIGRIVEHT